MPAPRLSIVIPTLNEEAQIAGAVASAWRLAPTEVIVVDGGSRDATAAFAKAGGATVIAGTTGRGAQLRAGVEHAAGDVLLFLHADTRLDPAAAGQMAEVLASRATAWGAFRQKIDADGWRYRALEAGNAFRARRLQLPYGDQAMFVRREALDAVGGIEPLPIMEDVDLSRRLRKVSAPALLEGPLQVSSRRWRRSGVVRQTARNWMLLLAWRLGVSPQRLARWYRPEGVTGEPDAGQAAAATVS